MGTTFDKNKTLGVLQGLGLRALTTFSSSDVPDRLNIRKPTEHLLYEASRLGFKLASKFGKPRNNKTKELSLPPPPKDLFDLNLTEEQQLVRDTLRAFATEVLRPAASEAENKQAIDNKIIHQAAELGLRYYALPEALTAMTVEDATVTQILALEDLAYGDFSMAAALFAGNAFINTVARYGTPYQHTELLKKFNDQSEMEGTIATIEPDAIYDPYQLKTKAKKQGNEYILNGEKQFVIRAEHASYLIVSAMLDNQPSLFVVPRGVSGLTIEPAGAMGLKAASMGKIKLRNVHLSEDALLKVNYKEFLDLSYLGASALATGTTQAILDYVIRYANEREAFGEPISHRQAVAFMISNIAIELEAMRLMTWRAAALAQKGKPFHREAQLAYQYAIEHSTQIGNDAVQILGGHGYTKEHPVERWHRDLRSLYVLHGSNAL